MRNFFEVSIGVLLLIPASSRCAEDRFVDINSTNASPPYLTWATAARTIQEAINVSTNGDVVWVTNGVYFEVAVTLNKALTVRSVNGPASTTIDALQSGNCAALVDGAVLQGFTLTGGAASGSAAVANCSSALATIESCRFIRNSGRYIVARGTLRNCAFARNYASQNICYSSTLLHCTVSLNQSGGALYSCPMTNTIAFNNSGGDVRLCTGAYNCSSALVGPGSITSDPKLMDDGTHLLPESPCRGVGTNLSLALDFDGQPRLGPPTIGCDEPYPEPVFAREPYIDFRWQGGWALSAEVAGTPPLQVQWFRNGNAISNDGHYEGTQSTTLFARSLSDSDAGTYEIVVSNAFGMVTSAFNMVVHFVRPDAANPQPPFLSWETAAANIQDAISVCAPRETVLATNGTYSSSTLYGWYSACINLDRPVLVQSVNGPRWSIIDAENRANTMCASLTNGAALAGFTLKRATNTTGFSCSSTNAFVSRCIITETSFGNFSGTIFASLFTGNPGNYAVSQSAALYNCTVSKNRYGPSGLVYNSIVYSNYYNGDAGLAWSCTSPAKPGISNISSDPKLMPDQAHIASDSPCVGAGTNLGPALGIDGMPFANPPSMGCAELTLPVFATEPTLGLNANGTFQLSTVSVSGQQPVSLFWLHDGQLVNDDTKYSGLGNVTLTALKIDASSAGDYQLVASNSFGVVTTSVVSVGMKLVNPLSPSPMAPFATWSSAATNIQDAIDAAATNEIVLVTNGVYAWGGRIMSSNLLNRVVIDRPLLVQSLNGPKDTVIKGAWDPATTNGPSAVRCVWITNGAIMSGFTVTGGATRRGSVLAEPDFIGGGVFGYSNALVANCLIVSNAAAIGGGGASGVTLSNCAILANSVNDLGTHLVGGGGAHNCRVRASVVRTNQSFYAAGLAYCQTESSLIQYNSGYDFVGAYQGTLINCTVSRNSISSPNQGSSTACSGVASVRATNCIIFDNYVLYSFMNTSSNVYSSTIISCCTYPGKPGLGNISLEPQLLADGVHLAPTSPCLGAGTNLGTRFDFEGQMFSTPPPMGCDQWVPQPTITLDPVATTLGPAGQLRLGSSQAAGATPLAYQWLFNGIPLQDSAEVENTQQPVMTVRKCGPQYAGDYQLIASNSSGMVTSVVAKVVVRCVNERGDASSPPYTTWETAATNIQQALDLADPGDYILVTNGVYASGGREIGGIANRIIIEKPLTLMSVNGAGATIVKGSKDPNTTNGVAATRCAYVSANAVINGFTFQDGATGGENSLSQNGGGILGVATPHTIINCVLSNNWAYAEGGGAYNAVLINCRLRGNSAGNGGGLALSVATNCVLSGNRALTNGGGVYQTAIVHCNVVANFAGVAGGGYFAKSLGQPFSSILYFNSSQSKPVDNFSAAGNATLYCCFLPGPATLGTTADPQLLDEAHVADTSPCIGKGGPINAFGTDMDGETWKNPTSIGCDEFYPGPRVGPMNLAISAVWPGPASQVNAQADLTLLAQVAGQASRLSWDFGDGVVLTNASFITMHRWAAPGTYSVTLTAFNDDNPDGVSVSIPVQVSPLFAVSLTNSGFVGTNLSLSFFGQAGVAYSVEQSTSLTPPVTWTSAARVVGRDLTEFFSFPKTTNGNVFYRVRLE